MSFISIICISQENEFKKWSLGMDISLLGKYDFFTFYQEDGDPTYATKSFYSIGISAYSRINNILKFETGVYYCDYIININSSPYGDYYPENEKIKLIEIPLNIRVEFLNYFFISSGLLLDYELHDSGYINNQTGIGVNLSLGLNHSFKSGVFIFAGPEGKFHIFGSPPNKLLGMDFKMGFGLNFKND